MSTPIEREHDRWSRAYLITILRHDTEGLINLLTDIDPISVWDRLDAVSATARDTILALTSEQDATAILARWLVADALLECTSPDGTTGG